MPETVDRPEAEKPSARADMSTTGERGTGDRAPNLMHEKGEIIRLGTIIGCILER